MQPWSAWLQASRPLASANVAIPLVLGQALAFGAHGRFSWSLFGSVQLIGVFIQLFIVFANDFADREGDAHNRTFNQFSGGSRVIPEGKLSPTLIAGAALVALAGLLALGVAALLQGLGPWLLVGTAATAALLWAYSYPPLRYAYRGGGEVLQGLGVGVVLP
ncbi:MAG: prenyltransferase, partial [Myxococcales bacterium]|nr:prenyltransferase [Myxococcales bacterium]